MQSELGQIGLINHAIIGQIIGALPRGARVDGNQSRQIVSVHITVAVQVTDHTFGCKRPYWSGDIVFPVTD